MVVTVIEFIVKQLYILHRKPFVLQMLGSVASILDMDEAATYGDANKVSVCTLKSGHRLCPTCDRLLCLSSFICCTENIHDK